MNGTWGSVARVIGIAILVLVFLAVLTLVNVFPYFPADAIGWGILIGCGVPAFVALEVASTKRLRGRFLDRLAIPPRDVLVSRG
jgi:uncharacterized membrane protein (DUF441 family)